jgi:glycosyltransferase involved in cell wall biosynthesis
MDLIGVGSLIPLKQYDLFVQAVKAIKARCPGVSAMLCGKGPEETRLRKMILDQDLQHQISLTGELPHGETLQWLSRSRILLHPSAYEGFSGACLEALYAGAHVISFCDPMAGRIPHWHVVKDVEEMADCALRLLEDPATDHGRVLVHAMDESAARLMGLFYNGKD